MSESTSPRKRVTRGVQGGGQFAAERTSEPELKAPLSAQDSESAEAIADPVTGTWVLDMLYNGQWPETMTGNHTGRLPKPHRSDSLFLTELLGFKRSQQSASVDTSLSVALADPASVIGHFPVFMTSQDAPTNVRGGNALPTAA
jgi:hypothetical protein